jgi:tetratricopeptide (TPR) repeat protein
MVPFVLAVLLLNAQSAWCAKVSDSRRALEYKVSGDLSLKSGDALRAIAEYQKAIELNPHSTATLFNLAIAYYSIRDIDGTISTLKKILAIDPADVEVNYNLACLLLYQGNLKDAQLHFEKTKACCDGNPKFGALASQGLEYLNEFKSLNSPSRDLALFLLQMQQGLNPSPIVL